jgi:hypothetical protein
VFSIAINYTARRAASQKACTSLKHRLYLFHHHQMRLVNVPRMLATADEVIE